MSNESKHTPGPWHYTRAMLPAERFDITARDDGELFTIARTYGHAAQEADAALIARAPDLLAENEALRAQVQELRAALELIRDSEPLETKPFVCDFDTLQSVARAALAKVGAA